MYKRGFIIFGVVSLTMGNSGFPTGNRSGGDIELFGKLFLSDTLFLSKFSDETPNFLLIHTVTSLMTE